MQRARKLTAAAALALTALLAPATATHAITVDAVADVAPVARTPRDAVAVAGDASGAAVVAWLDGTRAHVARRAARGRFAELAELGGVDQVGVALRPGGGSVVVLGDPSFRRAYRFGRLDADGTFTQDMHRVSETGTPRLTTLADGTVLAVWGFEAQLFAATLAPGAVSWTVEQLAADPRGLAIWVLDVQADEAGGATVAWNAAGGRWSTIEVARRPPGGPFAPAVRLADGGPGTAAPGVDLERIDLAADRDGVTVVYVTRRESLDTSVSPNRLLDVWLTLEGRRWTPGGGWEAPVTLDRADEVITTGASLGVDGTAAAPTGDGGALLTWSRVAARGAERVQRTVRWPAGGAPQTVADEPPAAMSEDDGVALRPLGGGTTAVVYGSPYGLWAGTALLPAPVLGGLTRLATGVTATSFATTFGGHALLAWVERNEGGDHVRVGRFETVDPDPPVVDGPSQPADPSNPLDPSKTSGPSDPSAPTGPSGPGTGSSTPAPPRGSTGVPPRIPGAARLSGLRVARDAGTGALRLRLRLAGPARVRAVLERRAGGRWQAIRTTSRALPAGAATLPLTARRPTRGRYRVRVTATGADGTVRTGGVAMRVG